MNSTLSTFNTMTEVPLSKALGAGAMAAHCSGCVFTVCVFTTHCCVVHLDGLNAEDQFRVWVTILDNTSHIYFYFIFMQIFTYITQIFTLTRQSRYTYKEPLGVYSQKCF